MSRLEDQLINFDQNGPGLPDQLFGLPFTIETARVVIIPVPWEATVSYRAGTAGGPEAILKASRQVDLFVREIPDAWKLGIAMMPSDGNLREVSNRMKMLASLHRTGPADREKSEVITKEINEASELLNFFVRKTADKFLASNKLVGLVGGDHSTVLGLIGALSEKHDRFAILQIDAHADLRKAYEGFSYSHASIMYNALKIPAVSRVVQVGIRDLCEEEFQTMKTAAGRVKTFFDDDLKAGLNRGKTWEALCTEIIKDLPQKVYISFDIDGLDPRFCPNTGTPVPGGLEFHQAVDLIRAIATSGRTIIGFDLNEVAPGEHDDWDANVGARLLWNLCNWTGVSNGYLIPATKQ